MHLPKFPFIVSACLILSNSSHLCFADPNDSDVLTVAVFDFDCPDERGAAAAALLTASLSANGSLHLVERADLAKVLAESEITLTSNVTGPDAMKVGNMTGAKVIITGRIFTSGGRDFLIAKCIGTETGRVFAHSVDYKAGGDFSAGISTLSKAITEILTTKKAEILPKIETNEERIRRLREITGNRKLPPVYVSVSEQHLSRPVPDPAAQVEIQHTLQEIGFPVVDRAADATFIVSGEAFSEMAGRHGNLTACRARLEIKVSTPSSKEIKVDRQTSVALDLAENVAAKSALQEAGRLASERIIVHLLPSPK